MKIQGNRLSDLALKASILYLGLHVIDAFCYTAVGGFLILAPIATVGWIVPLIYVNYVIFGDDSNMGAITLIAGVLGSVTALKKCSEIYGKRARKRRRRKLNL